MIVYFSGTGNSKYVAERVAAALNDKAVSIEETLPEFSLSGGECFGIVSPTNWLELPVPVREFIRKLELKQEGERYIFLIATYGSTTGCIGTDAKKELAERGIALDASFSIKMPDNWTPMFDLSRPEEVAKINQTAEVYLDNVIRMLRERKTGNHTEMRVPYLFRGIFDRILERDRRTANFYVENTCIGCGLCAGRCPAQAIEMQNGKPVWVKERCAICFRCVHHCPAFAIQYGNGNTKKHGQYTNPNVKV